MHEEPVVDTCGDASGWWLKACVWCLGVVVATVVCVLGTVALLSLREPFVDFSEPVEAALKSAFLDLDKDDEGRGVLTEIGVERFVAAEPEDYRTAIEELTRSQRTGGAR